MALGRIPPHCVKIRDCRANESSASLKIQRTIVPLAVYRPSANEKLKGALFFQGWGEFRKSVFSYIPIVTVSAYPKFHTDWSVFHSHRTFF